MFPPDDAAEGTCKATWPHRIRLDAIQLKERALACQDIKDKVFDNIKCLTKGKSCQQERMADVKGMPREWSNFKSTVQKNKQPAGPLLRLLKTAKTYSGYPMFVATLKRLEGYSTL